MIEEVGSV